jgi:hypothetical protein
VITKKSKRAGLFPHCAWSNAICFPLFVMGSDFFIKPLTKGSPKLLVLVVVDSAFEYFHEQNLGEDGACHEIGPKGRENGQAEQIIRTTNG